MAELCRRVKDPAAAPRAPEDGAASPRLASFWTRCAKTRVLVRSDRAAAHHDDEFKRGKATARPDLQESSRLVQD